MKTIIQIILIFVLISCENKNHKTDTPTNKISIAKEIQIKSDSGYIFECKILNNLIEPIIENQFRINKIKNWTKIDSLNLSDSTEGGIAYYLYYDISLDKIIQKEYGEMRKIISEYYTELGDLTLIYEKLYEYNRPIYWDSLKMKENNDTQVFDIDKSEIIEYWTYFKNAKLITQKNNQEDCPSSSEYLKSEQKRLLSKYERLLNEKK